MRTTLAALFVTGAVLACPVAAGATTPSIVSNDGSGGNVFKGGANAVNAKIDITSAALFEYEVTDGGNPLVAQGSCAGGGLSAFCPLGGWTVTLGPLSDRLWLFTAAQHATITTGAGDDVVDDYALRGTLHTGPGEDVVRAGGQVLEIYGNTDDDKLYGTQGSVRLFGGGGQDVLLTAPTWDIAAGADGGDGYDIVFAANVASSLSGGADDDILGYISPNSGRPTVDGGSGNDVIYGSDAQDRVTGGPGNDEIRVYGGGADTVDCGGSFDSVYADASDTVVNCEQVRSSAGPVDPRYEAAKAKALALR